MRLRHNNASRKPTSKLFQLCTTTYSRVFQILKSTRRDKPLLYSCRAANLLQETYLGCLTIQKVNFFWTISPQKNRNFQAGLFCFKQSLGSGQKHVEFFLFMGIPLLLFFEQVFYLVDLRNKLPLNTNQLTCGRLLHVSFFVLASFIASDLTKKLPFMKFETKLLASSLLCEAQPGKKMKYLQL